MSSDGSKVNQTGAGGQMEATCVVKSPTGEVKGTFTLRDSIDPSQLEKLRRMNRDKVEDK